MTDTTTQAAWIAAALLTKPNGPGCIKKTYEGVTEWVPHGACVNAADTLRALAAERDALKAELDRIKRGQWFYSADGYESESCFSSPSEVLEEVYFWDRAKSGVHLVEINVATPLPSIWAVVSFRCECQDRDACDCDAEMVIDEFGTKAEAEAAYREASK